MNTTTLNYGIGGYEMEREFHSDDIVFAALVHEGRQVAHYRLTGVTALADIVAYVRSRLVGIVGRVVMRVRNYSQGWSVNRGLLLAPARPVEGTQLQLF